MIKQRYKIKQLKPQVLNSCKPGILEISGMIAGLSNSVPFYSTSIFLSDAELDLASHIDNWITAFIDLAYSETPPTLAGQLGNSNVYLDRIFITFGNLMKFPYYITIGRRYVPFGQYYSYLITGPLTQPIEKAEASSILIGYYDPNNNGLYSSAYVLKAVKKLFWDTNQSSVAGFTTGYNFYYNILNIDVAFDYIQSIAVSQAFQDMKYQTIPGVALHTNISLGNLLLITEFTKATQAFNINSLSIIIIIMLNPLGKILKSLTN